MESKPDKGKFVLKKRWFIKNIGDKSSIEEFYDFKDKKDVNLIINEINNTGSWNWNIWKCYKSSR